MKSLLSFVSSVSSCALTSWLLASSLASPNVLLWTSLLSVFPIYPEFDVEIPTVEIIPANFNSAQKIWELIEKLKED